MIQQQRIARNTLLAIVGVAGAGVVRLAFTVATGRAFGTAVLGDIAVILALATITTIPAAGVGAAGNRFLALASGAKDDSLRSNTLGATWRGAMLVTGAAVALSWVYLRVQTTPNLDTTAVTLGLVFVATYGLYLTSKSVLFGDGKAGSYALGEVIGVAAFVVVLAALYVSSASSGWILLSLVIWALGVTAAAVAAHVGPAKLRRGAPRGLWPFAATATAGSLVSLGLAQATVLVMAAMHGSEQAGLLAAAVAITAPLYLLPRGLSLALTPSMSSHVGAESRERADLDTTYTTTLLVLFGGVAAASIIALTDIVLTAYGPGFADAEAFVAVFAVASFIAIAGIPVVNRFSSEGARALRVTVIASAVGAVGAVGIWLSLGRNDPTWIAIGFLVANIVKVAIPFALSGRVVGKTMFPGVGVSLLAATAVAATFLPQPWPFVSVTLLIVTAIPVLFVATVRYRARAARLTERSRPLTIGILTNMYPMPQLPHYGVFVRDRAAAYEDLGAKVVVTPLRHRTGVVKYLRLGVDALVTLATQPIPDVYEVHPTQPTGVIAMAVTWIAERPYVLYAHGADVTIEPPSRIYRSFVDRSIGHAAEIHTNSSHLAGMLKSRWESVPNIVVIPPGVHVSDAAAADRDRDIDVLFVGNMIHRKGADVLIDAASLIATGLNLKIVIAGGGPDLDQLRRRAIRADLNISFPGTVEPESVGSLMARAKVVAVPSRYEALGQVALEALAQGTPVVVSDTGGLASTPTPECGSVVPPEDPKALAEALALWIHLTSQQRADVARAAHARATEFAIDRVAAQALIRFKSIARRGRTTSVGLDGEFPASRID